MKPLNLILLAAGAFLAVKMLGSVGSGTKGAVNVVNASVVPMQNPTVIKARTQRAADPYVKGSSLLTTQEVSKLVQQSFGVKHTQTINSITVPITNNEAQNANNKARALMGLMPI
jgi:hypothetical protein